MRRRPTALLIAGALLAAACSGADDSPNDAGRPTAPPSEPPATAPASEPPSSEPPPTDPAAPQPPVDDSPLAPLTAEVRPGVEQLAVIGATPGDRLEVLTENDEAIAAGEADASGSWLARGLEAGTVVEVVNRTAGEVSDPVEVITRTATPDPSFYAEQRLPAPGFGYLTTRDGTTLSANVVLPGPPEDGPYPTVVEYSGYTPSDPDEAGFKDLFAALGYAYVGVNMRGTGCSGGSFRFFEYTQSTDGYDVIEAVAAQPWVLDNRVGMVGVSYPGISQLFVAQTQPPSLAAITPLSVIDDSYNSTLYPGGILNTGFAVEWTQQRQDESMPEGQRWAADLIAAGDAECAANQSLRLQNPDLVGEIRATPFYVASLGDDIAPRLFVDKITVPTFVAGAWQDEQTGGRFATMLDRFTGTDHLYASLVNGLHTESIGPGVFPRYKEFLDLYVAGKTPEVNAAGGIANILGGGLFGNGPIEFPPDRFAGMTHEEALAAFEAEPPIQVLFEEGAADGQEPLAPLPRFVESFEAWPVPGTTPTTWYLAADGRLTDALPTVERRAGYVALPDGVAKTFWDGNSSDLWKVDVEWDWQPNALGTAAVFTSAPLDETLTMVGSGSVDLWVGSNLGDTDLEVTLTEIRPDGQEVYVQSGWLRASHRALDEAASTELRPVHTHREADARALPDAVLAPARVEIFPFAHVFRAASQIRLTVDAPGGNRAVWVFETIARGERVEIGLGGLTASKIVLPVVPGIEPPAGYPACDSLRGQPCRPAPSTAPPALVGADLAVDTPVSYELGVHCGAAILGYFNGRWWRTAEGGSVFQWIPAEWDIDPSRPDGPIAVELRLLTDGQTIVASYNGRDVVYTAGDDPTDSELCD